MRLILTAAIIVTAFVTQQADASLFKRQWGELDPETIVETFSRVAFTNVHGKRIIVRWNRDHTIKWHSINLPNKLIAKIFSTISENTNLQFEMVNKPEMANYFLGTDTIENIETLWRRLGSDDPEWGSKICDGMVNQQHGNIFQGFSAIPVGTAPGDITTCLFVEITQTMGFFNDIPANFDTVTQAGYFTLDRLPEVDQFMLRILYDPRLKAGMTREEAMPIVRRILPEYWEKYGPGN